MKNFGSRLTSLYHRASQSRHHVVVIIASVAANFVLSQCVFRRDLIGRLYEVSGSYLALTAKLHR